jgi:hypothetical protein
VAELTGEQRQHRRIVQAIAAVQKKRRTHDDLTKALLIRLAPQLIALAVILLIEFHYVPAVF